MLKYNRIFQRVKSSALAWRLLLTLPNTMPTLDAILHPQVLQSHNGREYESQIRDVCN